MSTIPPLPSQPSVPQPQPDASAPHVPDTTVNIIEEPGRSARTVGGLYENDGESLAILYADGFAESWVGGHFQQLIYPMVEEAIPANVAVDHHQRSLDAALTGVDDPHAVNPRAQMLMRLTQEREVIAMALAGLTEFPANYSQPRLDEQMRRADKLLNRGRTHHAVSGQLIARSDRTHENPNHSRHALRNGMMLAAVTAIVGFGMMNFADGMLMKLLGMAILFLGTPLVAVGALLGWGIAKFNVPLTPQEKAAQRAAADAARAQHRANAAVQAQERQAQQQASQAQWAQAQQQRQQDKAQQQREQVAKHGRSCPQCHGAKMVMCHQCKGDGYYHPSFNSPKTVCPSCVGAKETTCGSCRGAGKVYH